VYGSVPDINCRVYGSVSDTNGIAVW